MKLIIGLGNPGNRYKETRHNIGFKVIDQLCEQLNVSLNKEKFQSVYCVERYRNEKYILLKPLTYMNLSGQAVRQIVDYYDISVEDILVIYDDLDLPVGKIRLRQKGSAGGHNGIKSIISHLGTDKFNRIRIGIDRPQAGMTVPDYVLSTFSKEELEKLSETIKRCADASEQYIEQAFTHVMNKFN